jgi:hypothetical protein
MREDFEPGFRGFTRLKEASEQARPRVPRMREDFGAHKVAAPVLATVNRGRF